MRLKLGQGLNPIDIGGTNAQTTGFWMGDCAHVTAVFRTATDYTDTTCVCSVREATSATGANEQAIAALSQTLTGSDQECVMDLSGEDMDTGFDYLMFRATEGDNDGNNYVSIDVIGIAARYKYDGMTTYDQYDSV
jgi:hypothetical protein